MNEKYADLALAAAYALGAAVGLGLFGLENMELLGVVLSDTLTTLGGYDVAYHHGLSAVGLAGAWIVNQPSWSRLDGLKKGLVALSVVILGLSVLSPETLESIVTDQTVGIVVFALQGGGYWGIAHK